MNQSRFLSFALAVTLALGLSARTRADLADYFKKPEPAYKWELKSEKTLPTGKVYGLHLVSQEWQGILWEHELQVFVPDNVDHPEFCVLHNTGGNSNAASNVLGMTAAQAGGTLFAILYNIPNQPLYGGKTEDALIVHTWLKYLETGDETWPLHFPMAKAVLKAMDAIQALAKEQKMKPVTGFMINGGSKRGWTTWLAAASKDPRIKAIAPMVIDTLNLRRQIPHTLASYGKPSEQVEDYTSAGMMTKLATKEGQRLIDLEDPWSYRAILTLPKLLILGTNDRYWTQDALNMYWDDLKGPKWVSYTPNSGHGLEDRAHVLSTLTAFAHTIAAKRPWPKMKWEYQANSDGATLTVNSDIPIQSARLFRVYAPTKDFRDSKWTSEPMSVSGDGGFTGHLDSPETGYAAIFGETTYTLDGKSFTLSTQIKILGKKK